MGAVAVVLRFIMDASSAISAELSLAFFIAIEGFDYRLEIRCLKTFFCKQRYTKSLANLVKQALPFGSL